MCCIAAAATCRHTFPVAAANMIRTGERYAYGFSLLMRRLWVKPVDFIHWDVGCKVRPWLQRAVSAAADSLGSTTAALRARLEGLVGVRAQPPMVVLPETHGRLHSVWCWVSR